MQKRKTEKDNLIQFTSRRKYKWFSRRIVAVILIVLIVIASIVYSRYQSYERPAAHTPCYCEINTPCHLETAKKSYDESMVVTNTLSMSKEESNDWFIDIPVHTWDFMKLTHFKTRHNQIEERSVFPNGEIFNMGAYANFNWKASFNCPVPPLRIGETYGGKVMCDTRRLMADDCLVYSIGSAGNLDFEREILKINPNCEIHTFDHTWNGYVPDKNIHYHNIGLGLKSEGKFKTLSDILKINNHMNKPIHILKIDCEGCEYDVYPNFYMNGVDIRQLLMEVHYKNYDKAEDLMNNLHKNGFVIFSKEPNTAYSDGRAIEFSFLRFNPTIFH